jgi:anaerobic magnesium-protoporphyrin IX monomethyl ester cyclase
MIKEKHSMKTVLLIRPDLPKDYPFGKLPSFLPLGLGFLAGTLKEAGYHVEILDNYLYGKQADELIEDVRFIKPDLIGLTVAVATTSTSADIVSALGEENIPLIVGGPQVTIDPIGTLKRLNAEIGVVGEGENTLLELCQVLYETGSLSFARLKEVNGLVLRDGENGEYYLTPNRELVRELDKLPFVPVSLFPYQKYQHTAPELKASPLGWMSTSRGCPWNCSFCSNILVWGRHYRCMGPKRVVDEIQYLADNFGVRAINFREDNFTVNKQRVMGICSLIKERNLKIEWMCESRVDIIDEEMLTSMKQAGCSAIYFGIESGTQRVLDLLRKETTVEQNETAVNLCKKVGIRPIVSIMLGIPRQTLKENYESISFVKKLDPDMVYFNVFMGFPGTDLCNYIIEHDLIYKKLDQIILPNSECLTWPEKLKLKQKAELLYNISPKILFRHIKRIGLFRTAQKGVLTIRRYIQSRSNI